ncbi:MAG: sulfatase-like hydrolase/transferase [Acidobacteriota bacterium]
MKRCAPLLAILLATCVQREVPKPPAPVARPSILLVTLDTTRADAIGPEAKGVQTPAFNALAREGRRFRQAYATAPQTLPSHTSMMTGLYPAGHAVHENGRYLADRTPLLAEQLLAHGYRTAAFVSAFALARRFGLARGFASYDDDFGGERVERTAEQTTDRAVQFLERPAEGPLFLWVHYYDPHYPYAPPPAFRKGYEERPYYGEVAAMDQQLGRLAAAFRQRAHGPIAIVIVADHGEGLGEHGEAQHGNLLYQATMHVPLLISGPGFAPGVTDTPVSTRTIFDTVLEWAGLPATNSLRKVAEPVIAGEAMKPFLDYGWQPQVMAVEGRLKTILAGGKAEVYDVAADPAETHDLGAAAVPRAARASLRDYPVPAAQAEGPPSTLSEEERRKLASLGYVASTVRPVVRADAPRPADMASLFGPLDEAAALFVRGRYAEAIPLLERILATDPHNLDAALRLATSHSSLGQDREAESAFQRAGQIAPDSADVRTYHALHLARGSEWPRAVPMLERIVNEDPDRLPPLEALAVIRERQGRVGDAVDLRQRIYRARAATPAEWVRLGEMAMELGRTPVAIEAFEKARAAGQSHHDLELGVLYLAAGRLDDARTALDRLPATDPQYAMATFKRAQVSVLLHEPDAPARIALAREHADATTRELIARERLFQR